MKKFVKITFAVIFLLALSVMAMSQVAPHPTELPQPGTDCPPVALDGGLIMMIALGTAYAIRKKVFNKKVVD
jgi:hypothetical protein